MRDLTWLSGAEGSSRAAAHARFVMAHQASRELREHARHKNLAATAPMDEELQRTLAILFPQQYVGTTVR
jgi:hypothetical protein